MVFGSSEMKFLIFTYAIAFILQNYGTFQTRPLEDREPYELAEAFKQYALDFVTAAIKPLVKNEVIMNGGCECLRDVEKNDKWNPVDSQLAVMAIAKYHQNDLEVIRKTTDLFKMKLDAGFMRNLRAIVIGHECASDSDSECSYTDDTDEQAKEYLRVAQPGAAAQARDSDESRKSDVDCYRTILSIYDDENDDYFDALDEGITIVNGLARSDTNDWADDAKKRLREIIEDISECDLTAHDPDETEDEFKDLLKKFGIVEKSDSDEETDSDY